MLEKKAEPVSARQGQALVDFAAAVPMLFLLVVLAMNFGGLINAWVNVSNAARAAADFAVLGGVSAHLPTQATGNALMALINADLAYLPNVGNSNPQMCVRVENNDSGHPSILLESPTGACASYAVPPADAEPVSGSAPCGPTGPYCYANLAVDITYTYTPFFTGSTLFSFPLVTTPTSVHQRAVMRILQ